MISGICFLLALLCLGGLFWRGSPKHPLVGMALILLSQSVRVFFEPRIDEWEVDGEKLTLCIFLEPVLATAGTAVAAIGAYEALRRRSVHGVWQGLVALLFGLLVVGGALYLRARALDQYNEWADKILPGAPSEQWRDVEPTPRKFDPLDRLPKDR